MDIKTEIKSYIGRECSTVSEVADKIGTSRSALSQKINNESLRYKDVKQIAELLGYEIVWKKKD